MEVLPTSRLTINLPFTKAGIYYVGPIDMRVSKGRNIKTYKGYNALFVCFTRKTVHIEVVSDLILQKHVAPIRRFVKRHGTNIYSDNVKHLNK